MTVARYSRKIASMKIYVVTAVVVASGVAHIFADAVPVDAVSINTLVNAIGAVLLGVVAWLVQLGVRSVLDRLNKISKRLRRVEDNQLIMATKLRIELPEQDHDDAADDE